MDIATAQEVLNRAIRCMQALAGREGKGASWSAQVSDGSTQKYIINGTRPLEEIEQDFESAFVWLWSLKDYIKEVSEQKNRPRNWIEKKVNADERILLSADVANLFKHAKLQRPRSSTPPKLQHLRINLPQTSIKKIQVRADEVEFDTQNLSGATLTWPIRDAEGRVEEDGILLLDYCVKFWEESLKEIGADV